MQPASPSAATTSQAGSQTVELEPQPPLAESDSLRKLRFFSLVAVLVWCAIPLSPQRVDSDFWGHVQYGRDTMRFGLARESTYSFTSPGYRWINHENLSEMIFATGVDQLGASSLLVLKCFLGLSVLGLAVWRAKTRRVSEVVIAAVCILSAVNLSFYWGLRPHVFSFVFFGWMIAWLDRSFEDWSGRWQIPGATARQRTTPFPTARLRSLWLMPLLLCLWANTHGGFLAGVAVFVTILGGRAIEVILSGNEQRWRIAGTLAAIAVLGCLATLCNPYGAGLHLWLIESLGAPRPEILEWHPPEWFVASSLKLWLLLGLAVFGFTFTRKTRDLTQFIVMALVMVQACKHQRHLPFVALLLLFWLPPHLHSSIDRFRKQRVFVSGLFAQETLTRLITAYVIGVSCLFAYRVGTRFDGVPVSAEEYPVDAVQYLAEQSLTGRLVVSGQWAQYLIGTVGARTVDDEGVQVAFDGRFRTCYPQEVVDLHFDFFLGDGGPDKRYRSDTSPAVDGKRLLDFRDPDLVLLNRIQPAAVNVMSQATGDWVLLYQDPLAQLWGRRSTFDDPAKPSYVDPHVRQLSGSLSGVVAFPAAPVVTTTTDSELPTDVLSVPAKT